MDILIYSYREDEVNFIKAFGDKLNVKLKLCKDAPSIENAKLAEGIKCISIITTTMSKELLEKFYEYGVRFISTRTIGYDHIDINTAKRLGISVGNVTYSTNSVADYTVMMMLMAIRKMKVIMERGNVQDYSLKAIRGKELEHLTIGVIGTGNIGKRVIKNLSGFGSKILAYDLYENDEVKKQANYVELDELFKKSDIITLHMPSTNDNFHMINKYTISIMKDGVFIINTARGSLINTADLIDAIESKKIGGVALDVIEDEESLYYKELKSEIIDNRNLAILRSFPNVILTPHTAFYTDEAVSDMVENSIKSCKLFMEGKENPWAII